MPSIDQGIIRKILPEKTTLSQRGSQIVPVQIRKRRRYFQFFETSCEIHLYNSTQLTEGYMETGYSDLRGLYFLINNLLFVKLLVELSEAL